MKAMRCNGIWAKVVAYAVIVTMNIMYMPLINQAPVYAAKSNPKVFVFGVSPDGDNTPLELQGMTEAKFKELFDGERRITIVSAKEARQSLRPVKRQPPTPGIEGTQKDLKKFEKYLSRAEEALEEEEVEDLYGNAKKAVKYLQRAANLLEDYDKARDAYVYLAAGAEEMEEDGALAAMQTALSFDPEYSPKGDLKSMTRGVQKQADRARGNGELEISADPEDATIWVNGIRHKSPASLKNLKEGDYYVRVEARGFKSNTTLVELSGNSKKLDIVLAGEGGDALADSGIDKKAVMKDLYKKVRAQNFDKAFFADAQRFGEWIEADYLVIPAFKSKRKSSKLYPLVFDVSSAKMGQVEATRIRHSKSNPVGDIEASFEDTRDAILEDFPGVLIVAGGPIGADAVEAADEEDEEDAPVVAAVEDEPEEDVYEEPAPRRSKPVAAAINLDVDDSVYFSDDDLSKAQEDSEGEESIAPVETTPLYKKWWLWTIVGVVVVGGTLGGLGGAGLLSTTDNSQPNRFVAPQR